MDKKNEFDEEEMTVELELEDGSVVTCAVVTILTVFSYIVRLYSFILFS